MSQTTQEIAKELTLKAMEKIELNDKSMATNEEQNEFLANEVVKIYQTIYKGVIDA